MSDLRPRGTKIVINGREYRLLASLNAIDAFQDRFDRPIEAIDKMIEDPRQVIKVLKFMLAEFINEGIDEFDKLTPHVDEKWVGRKIDANNINEYKEKFITAFSEGAPEIEGTPEIDGEDQDPNVKSE